jgi:hypothetical protein
MKKKLKIEFKKGQVVYVDYQKWEVKKTYPAGSPEGSLTGLVLQHPKVPGSGLNILSSYSTLIPFDSPHVERVSDMFQGLMKMVPEELYFNYRLQVYLHKKWWKMCMMLPESKRYKKEEDDFLLLKKEVSVAVENILSIKVRGYVLALKNDWK